MMNIVKLLRDRTPLGLRQLSRDRTRLLTAIAGITFAGSALMHGTEENQATPPR